MELINQPPRPWIVYILRCKDNTLYTGITDNLPKRLAAHTSGKGAKYTKGRAPLTLCYQEYHPDKSSALRREHAIKSMTRSEKLMLIEQ